MSQKESFKDKRLYLECCHSGRGFGQIFQGVDPGWGKNIEEGLLGRNPPSDNCRQHMHIHIFESCHSGCLFF